MCQIVGVARSSFYYWRATAPDRAARDAADAALAVRIRAVQADYDGTYGAPRITAQLHDEGLAVNHKRVARVMRRHRIQGLRLRRRVQTTIPDPAATKAPDLVGRNFTAAAVNQRYVGDITYLPVGERGFLYLATVIDLHSRRLVGWALADHMRTDLVVDALHAARRTRGSLTGAVFHSDHGAQYTSSEFARACHAHGIRRSMGHIGSSYDNALAESFFATLKRELPAARTGWDTESQARQHLFRWIAFYNHRRRHSAIGYLSPTDYETRTRSTTPKNLAA